MTTSTLALIILAAILAQVAVVVLLGLYRRKRQYRDMDERTSGTENISKLDDTTCSSVEHITSDLSWEGFKELVGIEIG